MATLQELLSLPGFGLDDAKRLDWAKVRLLISIDVNEIMMFLEAKLVLASPQPSFTRIL